MYAPFSQQAYLPQLPNMGGYSSELNMAVKSEEQQQGQSHEAMKARNASPGKDPVYSEQGQRRGSATYGEGQADGFGRSKGASEPFESAQVSWGAQGSLCTTTFGGGVSLTLAPPSRRRCRACMLLPCQGLV